MGTDKHGKLLLISNLMGEISKLYIYKLYILLFELYDNTVIKLLLISDLMGEISK